MDEKRLAMTLYSSGLGFDSLVKLSPRGCCTFIFFQICRGEISISAKFDRIECLSCFYELLRFNRAVSLQCPPRKKLPLTTAFGVLTALFRKSCNIAGKNVLFSSSLSTNDCCLVKSRSLSPRVFKVQDGSAEFGSVITSGLTRS